MKLIYRGPLIKDAPAELGDIRQWDIVAPGKPYNRMTVGVERLRQMGIVKRHAPVKAEANKNP